MSSTILSIPAANTLDPLFGVGIDAGQQWRWGIDNSDSDAWVLSASSALGTTNVMRVATTGEINFPLQSAFAAFLGSTVTNVSGTGTAFTLGTTTALTEIFDQNSDFNTNGTFTAPITGRYDLTMMALVEGLTVCNAGQMDIQTSNRPYTGNVRVAAGVANIFMTLNRLVDMDAADTSTAILRTFGEAGDTDDVTGNATSVFTGFSGNLEC